MESIMLRPDLLESLEQSAKQKAQSVNELVNKAVERYLSEEQAAKLDQEIAAYEAMHADLKQKYFRRWVAVHEQKLVDYDSDRAALYRRVRAKYGKITVLIRQVSDQPNEDLWIRTPSTGKINP